jgi:hypothetical protein
VVITPISSGVPEFGGDNMTVGKLLKTFDEVAGTGNWFVLQSPR